jgi:O-antigen ligase
MSGNESFRLPKEILFRAEAIVLCGVVFFLLGTRQMQRPRSWKDPGVLIPGAILIWAFISMLMATNRIVSLWSFLWIAGWTLIFVVTASLAREMSVSAVYAAIIPAVANGALVLLQESDIWNPFYRGRSLEHLYHSALIGNPNDVGTFLVAPTVAGFALIFADKSRRAVSVIVTLLLVASMVANHTLTALVAMAVGFVAVIFVISRKSAIAVAIFLALAGLALVRLYPPLWARYKLSLNFIELGNYDSVVSGRLMPTMASAEMFRDHPIAGVGPGCFKWEFFFYRLRIAKDHGNLVTAAPSNFGEVHNDHLQILAETGLPGYALFVAALIVIGSASFPKRREEARLQTEREFSRLAAFPLASSFAVLAIGQFPLELAASTSALTYLFALCYGWREPTAGEEIQND